MEKMLWVEEVLAAIDLISFIPCIIIFYIWVALGVCDWSVVQTDWLAQADTGAHMGRRTRKERVEETVLQGELLPPWENPMACAKTGPRWIYEETKDWENKEEIWREHGRI